MTPRADIDASEAVALAFERIDADGRDGIWIELADRQAATAFAKLVDDRVRGGEHLPLAGTTVAVKGNIDLAGHVTTAGCPSFGELAPDSAPAVRALEDAGAVVVGVTNLDQFATGLVGTRSPFGACPNAFWPSLVSGGSSSGSAVAVAAGLVDLALGTDTAGSGRVPAAANGIVGLKPTRASVSRRGVVPACRSLDSVSVFGRTVNDAAQAFRILRTTSPDAEDPWTLPTPVSMSDSQNPSPRIGVAHLDQLDFDGDVAGAAAHRDARDRLAAWADVVPVDVAPLLDTGRLLYEGAFVAERYTAVGEFVDAHRDDVDPVVARIISGGARVAGWEVFRDLAELERLRALTAGLWDEVDLLVLPTVPRIPTRAEVAADPFGPNTMLGTYTNFVNLLDLCALTVPATPLDPDAAGPPHSLTLIAPAWCDDLLIDVGRLVTAG